MIIKCECGNRINADYTEEREDLHEDIDRVYFARVKANGVFQVAGVRKAGHERCGGCLQKMKDKRKEES